MNQYLKKEIDFMKNLYNLEDLPLDVKNELKNALEMVESEIDNDYQSKKIIKFVNNSNNKNPEFSISGDSGFDLRANLKEDVILKPFERRLIDTGLIFELPIGCDMEIRSRSGLALKNGIMVLNSPGTIDYTYRGSLGVILINLGNEDFFIKNGDKIAQGLIRWSLTDLNIDLVEVETISDNTLRGGNGFGSTGVK